MTKLETLTNSSFSPHLGSPFSSLGSQYLRHTGLTSKMHPWMVQVPFVWVQLLARELLPFSGGVKYWRGPPRQDCHVMPLRVRDCHVTGRRPPAG